MDLIEREKLIEILAEMQGRCATKAALVQNSKIWQQVKDMPTVEAEPVRHGHWMDTTEYIGFPVWQCSKCNGGGRGDYFRCPWCGAKMDERTEE